MTRYEFFRKRIAPLLFLGMVGVIAYDACHKQERTRATVVIDLGEAASRVRGIDGELMVDGESFGSLHVTAPPGLRIAPVKLEARIPGRDAELQLEVDLDTLRRRVVRRIHIAEDGATITVPIGPELAAP